MTEHVKVTEEHGLRHIEINREARANALSIEMLRSIADAVSTVHASNAQAIVVSAAGAKGFCSGADLADLREHRREQYDALRQLILALAQRPVPVFCLMHGRALGAGCLLPLLSDVVIAADNAALGFPEMRFGMYPSLVHSVLVEKLPAQLAYQICVGARTLSASDALALGLITEVIPMHAFVNTAPERVAFYAKRIPAIDIGRQLSRAFCGTDLAGRVDRAEGLIDRNLALPDVQDMLERYLK